MTGRFLLALLVTSFIITSVDAAAQGSGAKVQDPLPVKVQDPSGDASPWSFDLNFRYAPVVTIADLLESTEDVESQLRALNYNTVQSEVDDTAAGWGLGAGITFNLNDHVGIRAGYSFTNFDPWTAYVEGSRINQPNTPSNLEFDTTTRIEMNQSLFEITTPLKLGPIRFNPGVMVVYASGNAVFTSGLLGAPIGQTPTTEVAAGNEYSDLTAWGLGFLVRASVDVVPLVEVGVSYERTEVDDVIPVYSGSYVTLTNVRTGAVVLTLAIRPRFRR